MGKVTTRDPRPGETFFGGGCGAIIPFRHIATEEVREESPAEGKDHEDKMGEQDDLYSPIPFDAFPGSDPDPEAMETIRKEVVAERIARVAKDRESLTQPATEQVTDRIPASRLDEDDE